MGITNKAMVYAANKGYKISYDGQVLYMGKIRKTNKDKQGYERFGVKDERDRIVSVYVHRLVAFQKYGNNIFERSIQVRHLNGNCLDNSYDNIAIGTARDNQMDKPKDLRYRSALQASRHIMHPVVAGYIKFESYRAAAKHFGISDNGIRKRIELKWEGYENKLTK
jgi:hypothetical protein